ncbi:methylmalonyl Co-A mutase-associated GTPase MeaB, partial [bacterium]|nr:methylmalonyl Co-A mutase-associated GTPase MeaB [bacterium]
VIEMADSILINKADGDNKIKAQRAMQEFNQALHYLKPTKEGWNTEAYCCSALTGAGIKEIWNTIQEFKSKMLETGDFHTRRKEQSLSWLHEMATEQIKLRFYEHPAVVKALPDLEQKITNGTIPVTSAVDTLLQLFYRAREEETLI